MNKNIVFISIGIIALLLRLFVNFRFELIPGINGGYYPVQVRQLLENGWIGFNDMPLYFLLNAFFVWLIDLFIDIDKNRLILYTVKIVDAFNFIGILFPVYFLFKNKKVSDKTIHKLSFALFTVLSIAPMILLSDNQKNSFGILMAFLFLSYIILNIQNLGFKQKFIAAVLLIMVLLSHFGTFVILLLLIALYLFFTYRKKAVLPIIVLSVLSFSFISVFDFSRAKRMVTFIFQIFQHPAFLQLQPPDFLNLLFAIVLLFFAFKVLKRMKSSGTSIIFSTKFEINVIKANIWLLIILSLPVISDDYFRRFQILTYIPVLLLLIFIFVYITNLQKVVLTVFMLAMVFVSIPMVLKEKLPAITYQAFTDLKNIGTLINTETPIVIARHGLEWWTAWALGCKIAQEKALAPNSAQYPNIYVLKQISGKTALRQHFNEPLLNEKVQLIYKSDYFELYKYK